MDSEKIKVAADILAIFGYFVLSVINDDTGFPETVFKSPVISWALDAKRYPHPVTRCGVQSLDSTILQPDGSVEGPGEWFSSVAMFLKSKQEDYTKYRDCKK